MAAMRGAALIWTSLELPTTSLPDGLAHGPNDIATICGGQNPERWSAG
jgi:hypothetical protein